MTDSPDQNREAMSAEDATTIVPTPDAASGGPVPDSNPAADGSDDAEPSTPYYETEWSPAYAQTEIRSSAPFEVPVPEPQPFGQQQQQYAEQQYSDPAQAAYGTGQPVYGQPYGQPVALPAYRYGTPYPQFGASAYGSNQGPPPAVSNTSAILAIVFGGMLVVGCYTTLIGIAPLALGIVSLNKSNDVAKLWYMGQTQFAYAALESSKNLSRWAWISMAIGFAVVLAVIAIVFIIAAASGA